MPISVETFFRQSACSSERLIEVCAQLTDDQLDAPGDGSYGSDPRDTPAPPLHRAVLPGPPRTPSAGRTCHRAPVREFRGTDPCRSRKWRSSRLGCRRVHARARHPRNGNRQLHRRGRDGVPRSGDQPQQRAPHPDHDDADRPWRRPRRPRQPRSTDGHGRRPPARCARNPPPPNRSHDRPIDAQPPTAASSRPQEASVSLDA